MAYGQDVPSSDPLIVMRHIRDINTGYCTNHQSIHVIVGYNYDQLNDKNIIVYLYIFVSLWNSGFFGV